RLLARAARIRSGQGRLHDRSRVVERRLLVRHAQAGQLQHRPRISRGIRRVRREQPARAARRDRPGADAGSAFRADRVLEDARRPGAAADASARRLLRAAEGWSVMKRAIRILTWTAVAIAAAALSWWWVERSRSVGNMGEYKPAD